MKYATLIVNKGDDHVLEVTLNRPKSLNSFDSVMRAELKTLWARAQADDAVHAIFLRANEGRAFCAGIDVRERAAPIEDIWNDHDPGYYISPKLNGCFKPLVTAVHGMAAGGAFYLINESDIVICSEDATFFDPHVTYGMTSACEPVGMTYKMPLGNILRMVLLGNDERVSAASALRMGIVTEIVDTHNNLWARGRRMAEQIASKPPAATQGSVKAIWESLDMPRTSALLTSVKYAQLGNPYGISQIDRDQMMAAAKSFDVI